MKQLLFVVVLCAACWTAFTRYQHSHGHRHDVRDSEPALPAAAELVSNARFSCDGRVYCSQMSSCEEATYFLQHCPGTKMDGDHDGIPCERQWCNGP